MKTQETPQLATNIDMFRNDFQIKRQEFSVARI